MEGDKVSHGFTEDIHPRQNYLLENGYGFCPEFLDELWKEIVIEKKSLKTRVTAEFPVEVIHYVLEAKCSPHLEIEWFDGDKEFGEDYPDGAFLIDERKFKFKRILLLPPLCGGLES